MMKSRAKVLFLHNIVAPYKLPVFEELAKKIDFKVFFSKKTYKERLWKIDLSKYSFKREILKNFTIGPFVFNFTLPIKLLKNRPDVYIVGEIGFRTIFSIIWVFFASRLFKKPLIIYSNQIDSDWNNQRIKGVRRYAELILGILRKLLYYYTDAFIAYGKKAREYLIRRGVPEQKIFLGRNVMPQELLQKVAVLKKDTEYKDKLVILTLSYLEKRKGIDYLIQAFKELNFDDAVLIIAGSGQEERNLRKVAGGADNIRFPGYVDGFEKFKWYSIADVFVLPTLHDPWGLVVNEAMYFGLPIITTEAAGASEMIDKNGFVIPPADKERLKIALKCLLENSYLRQKMGESSKRRIKTYNIDYAVKPFMEAINQTINLKKEPIDKRRIRVKEACQKE